MGANVSQNEISKKFLQNVDESCKNSCVAESEISGMKFIGNKGCKISLDSSASCRSTCDMSSLASALSDTVSELDSEVSSDFLPAIGITQNSTVSEIENQLSTSCDNVSYAKAALKDFEFVHNEDCEYDINTSAESESSCAIATVVNAIDQSQVSSTTSVETTFLSTLTGQLAIVAVVVVILAIILLPMIMKKGKKMGMVPRGMNMGVKVEMRGGFSDTSPALSITDWTKLY